MANRSCASIYDRLQFPMDHRVGLVLRIHPSLAHPIRPLGAFPRPPSPSPPVASPGLRHYVCKGKRYMPPFVHRPGIWVISSQPLQLPLVLHPFSVRVPSINTGPPMRARVRCIYLLLLSQDLCVPVESKRCVLYLCQSRSKIQERLTLPFFLPMRHRFPWVSSELLPPSFVPLDDLALVGYRL